MKILELRFYPITENLHRFQVSVESSFGGEAYCETSPPFLDGEIPDVLDRRFTVVKILESTKFDKNNFDEIQQAWMVREHLLLTDKSALNPQYLANIGRKLYQVLGNSIVHVIEKAASDAKRDDTWLHIRLRFPADVPKYVRLTDYPWELLHNDDGFLAHQGVTFSRYIAYRGIALVVLSACKSGMSLLSESVFNGVAQNLIGQGIPAVVAMQYSISVPAASAFAENFYRSLGEKEALTVALQSGRRAMGIEGNQWYRPVLYLRWEDNEGGQLFRDSSNTGISNQVDSPSKPDKKPLSRIAQIKIESLKKEIKKLEKDYEDVDNKRIRESNPQEQNNLQLQLDNIAKQMEEKEEQLNELGDGNEESYKTQN